MIAKQTDRPNMKTADFGLSLKGFVLQFLLLFLNFIKLTLSIYFAIISFFEFVEL